VLDLTSELSEETSLDCSAAFCRSACFLKELKEHGRCTTHILK